MTLLDQHLLSFIIFSPLAGLLVLPFLKSSAQKICALLASLLPLGLLVRLFCLFEEGEASFQFQEVSRWFQGFNVYYRLGVDGFSLPLLLLTGLLVPLSILASWREIQRQVGMYLSFFLLLQAGMFGVFAALDLFLFYVFWEVMLIPMYFLIGIWGGTRRVYAAMKFVLYTMFGSLLMLAAILYLYFAGGSTFNLVDLYALSLPIKTELLLFAAFAIAFAIKVPLFPFHTWLPDAHTEAPTGGSVLLAGVLLKMGTYGLVRFAIPLFPQAAHLSVPLFLVLSIIGIVYGGFVSMVQPDLKKLVAYSSVSHMGFVVLGIASGTSLGISGATLQMVNHGLSTGALFLLVGMIYERRHTRMINDFGGLATPMPLYALIFILVTLSSLGLPGTNGFVGEFLILLGVFERAPLFSALGAFGVVLAAVYLLWMIRRIFFGSLMREENRGLKDLSLREVGVLVPILILILWIGVAPGFLLDKINPTVDRFITQQARQIDGIVAGR
jgi:NADH-quinone oxidoreductase subunit M